MSQTPFQDNIKLSIKSCNSQTQQNQRPLAKIYILIKISLDSQFNIKKMQETGTDLNTICQKQPKQSTAILSPKQKLRLTVTAFVINLFYFASAFLHLMTATECKNYQNLVKSSNPIYNFKAIIQPLMSNLIKYGLLNLILLIINAGLILFESKVKSYVFYILPMIFTLIGMAVSLAAPINVLSIVSQWNYLNKSPLNGFTLYSSVFVSDLKTTQLLFRLQIFLGFFLFFLATVFSLVFWTILFHLNKKQKKVIDQQNERNRSMKQTSSVQFQEKKIEKIEMPQQHDL